MSTYEIENFLFSYPNEREDENDILDTGNKDFNDIIYRKKEFFDYSRPDEGVMERGDYLNHQTIVSRFMSPNTMYDGLLLFMGLGSGKCMKRDTPILMYDGSIKKVQDIIVGEKLMGDDSTSRTVQSLGTGRDIMYEIKTHRGESFVVNSDHILCLKVICGNIRPIEDSNNIIASYVYQDCFGKIEKRIRVFSTFIDAKTFVDNHFTKEENTIIEISVKDFINLPKDIKHTMRIYKKGIEFKEQHLDVHPYDLGKLIGGGSSFTNSVKINSRENRLNVLAGIIDSCGYYKNEAFVIPIKSKNTMKDILFLAQSLGFDAYEKSQTIQFKYKIKICGDIHLIPTRISENRSIQRQTINSLLYKFNIKKLPIDNYYGFTLDGNHRYMLDNFIVTHNTCTSVAVAEGLKNAKVAKRAIVLTRGSGLQRNFIEQLTFVCTDGRYIPENFDSLTELEKTIRSKKLFGDFYKFDTYVKFAKEIQRMRASSNFEEIANRRYGETLFIIDEAHNIREKETVSDGSTNINVYENFFTLFHAIKRKRVLLLTGTPMKDSPDEIASLLNLIMPMDQLIPTGINFNINTLSGEKMLGKVSYVRTVLSDITKEYIGVKEYGPLRHFIVYPGEMSEQQTAIYNAALRLDMSSDRTSGIFLQSRQASLMVDGNGMWGNNMNKDSLMAEINNAGNDQAKLTVIKKYSIKYHNIIKEIIENKDQLSFVYCSVVTGGGAIFLGRLLTAFGYDRAKRNNMNDNGLKYGIVTNATTGDAQAQRMIKLFNQPNNMFGQKIQVIIGSRVIGEGFSLKNVRQAHIATPFWNYTELDQAIARTLRIKSHSDLISEGIDPVVRIFQHVSVPINNQLILDEPIMLVERDEFAEMEEAMKELDIQNTLSEDEDTSIPITSSSIDINNEGLGSIDLYMYYVSEQKDVKIKRVERVLKQQAFDCALNYGRNVDINAQAGSRECDYQSCEWKCSGINNIPPTRPLLYDSYNNKYQKEFFDLVTRIIKQVFRKRWSISIPQLIEVFGQEYTPYQVITALDDLISNNMPIKNMYGINSFLKRSSNIIYLINNMRTDSPSSENYYTKKTILDYETTLENVLKQNKTIRTINILDELSTENDLDKRLLLFTFLDTSTINKIIEENILNPRDTEMSRWITFTFDSYIYKSPTGVVYNTFDLINVRCKDPDTTFFTTCSENEKSNVNSLIANRFNSIIPFYGIYNVSTKDFLIRDVSKPENLTRSKGQSCKTMTVKKLLESIIFPSGIESNYSNIPTNRNDMINMALSNKKIQKLYNRSEYESMSDDQIKKVLYWSMKENRTSICDELIPWFKENNKYQISF